MHGHADRHINDADFYVEHVSRKAGIDTEQI